MKYAGTTIAEIAQARGSAAKTKMGAWKYLRAHLGSPIPGLVGKKQRSSSHYDWERWQTARMERRADGRALVLGYSLDDPNTPGRILDAAWDENRAWDRQCREALVRNDYGEILLDRYAPPSPRPRAEVAGWRAAWELLGTAEKQGVIPESRDTITFDNKGRADGNAIHHDLYDFAPDAAVVCVRRTEGTRYGVKTLSKTYFLVESTPGKITSREISTPVAKYAKMQILHYGDICDIARGTKKIILQTPGMIARKQAADIARREAELVHLGWKIVRRIDDGGYASVWDGSPWAIGQERIEPVRDDHKGGLYYYRDLNEAITAAAKSDVFGDDKNHHRLAILAVAATGPTIRYNHKYAAERIIPLADVGSTL